jgi:hypothetical protein
MMLVKDICLSGALLKNEVNDLILAKTILGPSIIPEINESLISWSWNTKGS